MRGFVVLSQIHIPSVDQLYGNFEILLSFPHFRFNKLFRTTCYLDRAVGYRT